MHRLTFEQKEKQTREPFTELELDVLSSIEDPFWKFAIHLSLHYGLRLSDSSAELKTRSSRPMFCSLLISS